MIFLREYLTSRRQAPFTEIMRAAEAQGMSYMTLKRAKKLAGVTSRKSPGQLANWIWKWVDQLQ